MSKPKRHYKGFILIFILILSLLNILYLNSSEVNLVENKQNIHIKNSSGNSNDILVFFNQSSYNAAVRNRFEYYGGIIKTEWNYQFNSISGFAGIMPNETNILLYQQEFPDANIETDEIIEAQMNYATLQSKAVNSTWFLNGYKGDTDASVAVLDTGVNSNHKFLTESIIGWENFVNTDPISDDNGHGTFISSVITGTGTDPYNSINPTIVNLYGEYSHLELFESGFISDNYTLKIFSFNVSKEDSNIIISSIWDLNDTGISGFWLELYYNNDLVNFSFNQNTNEIYIIDHHVSQTGQGIYDLYIKYLTDISNLNPTFYFNASVSYYPEFYVDGYSYFTGIANATKIAAYKILNQSGIGYTSNLISALSNVIQNRELYKIVSVCLSLGTLGEDIDFINTVINEVIENGVLVVIAAGNKGVELNTLNKLALNKKAIVVGAINDNDQVTSYSSMGKNVGNGVIRPDLVAPGGSKISGSRSIIAGDSKSNSDPTAAYGTSIATAIVSAAINLLIEAKWDNWNQWNNLNITNWVKIIKAILLLTASETNLEREDDPSTTTVDESDYSPDISLAPLTVGLKDVHEGYGKLNIQAAIDAFTKSMAINTKINGTLSSSQEDPLGKHVFARRIVLTKNEQYLFNLTGVDENADLDLFLFSNESDYYGEPILLESSQKWYGDFDSCYFTPKENQTECIVVIKAIEGSSSFALNISAVENNFKPELNVPEIIYAGGSKNTTIMSQQEFLGANPNKNYSIDSFRFYIDYFDNDTSNVPPQEVYVSIIEISKNYTLTQFNPFDNNYTDGALYISSYIQFPSPGTYHYFFIGTDGLYQGKYPRVGQLEIKIEFPTDSESFPYNHSFNEGLGNWTITGTGWDTLYQINSNDNRSRIFENSWNSTYFGIYHNSPINYTYQPIKLTEDPYPNGTLFSPLFDLTNINENTTKPFAKFGVRVSINSGDYVFFQINLNWTGWNTLRIYSNEERDWFLEEINLTEYIGNFIQFRFETALDDDFDAINYKGFILDYFAVENYTNNNPPLLYFNLTNNISTNKGSEYQKFIFSCNYYDLDDNYPEYIYIEIENDNYTMINVFGDWSANSNTSSDQGILFIKSLILGDYSNHSFRFHFSDGYFIDTTPWYNQNNTLFEFINLNPLQFNANYSNKLIGYEFSNTNLEDYFVIGTPTPKENTAWLRGDNTWHSIPRLQQHYLYGGIGQSFGSDAQGYGIDWDAQLMTYPLQLGTEYDIYLEFDYEISLQNEYDFLVPEDQIDRCIVSISDDFGSTWHVLKEYTYDSEDLYGSEKFDISEYSGEVIMIKFTLDTNEYIFGLGWGWLLSNIYVGYDKSTDFIAPEIQIINPENDDVISSTISIIANITDNVELDTSRIYIYLKDKSVDRQKLLFNSTTGILEFKWDTTKYKDGNYEIRIVAFDTEG
ncbi:MAG: S8 family serine peptidase, partial [Candidatus Hodarchaeota archaeon]